MKKPILLLTTVLYFFGCKVPADKPGLYVAGVEEPMISLNGSWKVNTSPGADFLTAVPAGEGWGDVAVPGELMMQGIPIRHNEPFIYKKEFDIPADYAGNRVLLRFDGVYSYARLWIEGVFVRDHHGGFTRWDADITDFVTPGERAMLTLEVTDRADEISYASGYAKHQIGGILRDVSLLARPEGCPEDVVITTDLDEDFRDATLTIKGFAGTAGKGQTVNAELIDSDGNAVKQLTALVDTAARSFSMEGRILAPLLWDAEHPNLYTLVLSYDAGGNTCWRQSYRIGFREVAIEGNRMLVNGSPVKLRGACRHDIHPMLGRVSTPDYESRDVQLAKDANLNFIRTSHYPTTENFLSLCDEYGIYVEDETAVCFVGSHRTEEYYPGSSESDTAFTDRYFSQLEEQLRHHRNHPSVILWSVGNENSFGDNFKLSYDYVKSTDPTRPAIFSYPGYVNDSIRCYDILSMHYPGITGDMSQLGKNTHDFGFEAMPVIFDEWAHVACYNNFTVMEDPNVRDFWGRSLDSMWYRAFESDGGLGGAIWGMIDESFMLPENLPGYNEWWGKVDKHVIPAEYAGHNVGYGEWGIIDTWRREKPEFWNVKKAYSPVRLLSRKLDPGDNAYSIPVYNRFDHTNLAELDIFLLNGCKKRQLAPPDVAPHTKGFLEIPLECCPDTVKLELEFWQTGRLVDKYTIAGPAPVKDPTSEALAGKVIIEEDDQYFHLLCTNKLQLVFNKKTCLLEKVAGTEGEYRVEGPFLNLRTRGKAVIYSYHEIDQYGTDWQPGSISVSEMDNLAGVTVSGIYHGDIPFDMIMTVNTAGEMDITYTLSNIPQEYIRELGLKFILNDIYDSLEWKRKPYWSYYPEGHLSAAEGKVPLYATLLKSYRTAPEKDWPLDQKSFYYDGTDDEQTGENLANIARSTKENIYSYALSGPGHLMIAIKSNAEAHGRLSKSNDGLHLFASSIIDYVDLSWGNYQNNFLSGNDYTGKMRMKFGFE